MSHLQLCPSLTTQTQEGRCTQAPCSVPIGSYTASRSISPSETSHVHRKHWFENDQATTCHHSQERAKGPDPGSSTSTSSFFEFQRPHPLPRTPTKRPPGNHWIPSFQISPLYSSLETSQPGGVRRRPDRAGLNPTPTPSPSGRKTPLKALKF